MLAHEVVVLPPSAEAELGELEELDAQTAAAHPGARDVRMVVGVVRDGSRAAVLRLRSDAEDGVDDRLTGPDLAPALAEALLATLS